MPPPPSSALPAPGSRCPAAPALSPQCPALQHCTGTAAGGGTGGGQGMPDPYPAPGPSGGGPGHTARCHRPPTAHPPQPPAPCAGVAAPRRGGWGANLGHGGERGSQPPPGHPMGGQSPRSPSGIWGCSQKKGAAGLGGRWGGMGGLGQPLPPSRAISSVSRCAGAAINNSRDPARSVCHEIFIPAVTERVKRSSAPTQPLGGALRGGGRSVGWGRCRVWAFGVGGGPWGCSMRGVGWGPVGAGGSDPLLSQPLPPNWGCWGVLRGLVFPPPDAPPRVLGRWPGRAAAPGGRPRLRHAAHPPGTEEGGPRHG